MKRTLAAMAVMTFAASSAIAHSIHVPFFVDNPDENVNGFIGLQNTTDDVLILTLVYVQRDATGQAVAQPPQQFAISPFQGIAFLPLQVNNPLEGPGSAVPDAFPGNGVGGSLQIFWTGGDNAGRSVTGRYWQVHTQGSTSFAFGHLLDQRD